MPRLTSDSGAIAIELSLLGDTQTLSVSYDGQQVLRPSSVGLDALLRSLTGDTPDVVDVSEETYRIEESFRTGYGKRREHRHEALEATYCCTYEDGTVAELDVRVSDDGLAYRRRLPDIGSLLLRNDSGGFELPTGSRSWLTPYAVNHESTIRSVPVSMADGEYCTPGLFEVGSDTWVLLTESGVDSGSHAARLSTDREDTAVTFAHPGDRPGDRPVRATGSFETPWRVAVVGDLATVVETDLVPALADGPAVESTDWIEPGRVAWSWWAEPGSPSDPDRQRAYVEYAAERGWEYVLVDEGWGASWLPSLVEEAREQGVGIFVWAHWTELHDADRRRERFERWADWGVAGVKIDFMDSDDQGMMQFYEAVLADAAAAELLVNFHGSIVPLGLRRRWPHLMTYEGVQGAEHYKWATLTPEHNVTLPYTRNVVGPMDYTPVTFSAESRRTTAAHELALSIVYESGLQHFADGIDEYAARPAAEQFLESVPAAWDETRFLRGSPGSETTLARRRGETWFVGSIAAGVARTIELSFPFLSESREGVLLVDGEGDTLERRTVSVGPDSSLEIDVRENGGFALRC